MKDTKNDHLKVDGFCAVEASRQMDFDNFMWDNNARGTSVFACASQAAD